MRGLVRGPAEQRYLGPCGATPEGAIGVHASDGSLAYADDPMPTNVLPLAPCDGDVYGRPGGDKGTCRTCGAIGTIYRASHRRPGAVALLARAVGLMSLTLALFVIGVGAFLLTIGIGHG